MSKPIKGSYISLLLAILFAGCTGVAPWMEARETVESTVASQSMPATPLLTPTPASITPFSTSTNTPAASPTRPATITPTPTSTPIAVPTLEAGQAQARFFELLTNNGGCRLPCLWGMLPGTSTSADAIHTLFPLVGISYLTGFYAEEGEITPEYALQDRVLSAEVRYNTQNNVINRILFLGEGDRDLGSDGFEDLFDWPLLGESFQFYMLPALLTEHGPPTSISMFTFSKPHPSEGRAGGWFRIMLLYPDQGIVAHYTTKIQVEGSDVVGCLANAHVELDLYPPGNREAFDKGLAFRRQTELNNYRPLEEVTSLSINEFYETFRKPEDQCLHTPSHFWYEAEP